MSADESSTQDGVPGAYSGMGVPIGAGAGGGLEPILPHSPVERESSGALTPNDSRSMGKGRAWRAAASSVMSMATGHQVMQRPQPTQPELPNWSTNWTSLWVIHWR